MPIRPDRILYQDDWLLGVNKLSQELVVKGKGEMGKMPLLDFLRPQFPGIRPISRLDFETSGVLMFARNKDALEAIVTSNFRGWKKIYHALVAGIIPKERGEINFALPARMSEEKVPAMTKYTVLERFHGCCLVACEIETGRHHQIRRHFSMIKHPLLCDEVYGNKKINASFRKAFGYRRFFLHAASVEFPHPYAEKTVKVEAPRPKVFEEALKRMRRELEK